MYKCINIGIIVLGTYVPPALIFPRKNMKNELMDGAPIGSAAFTQENGYMNAEIFVKWLKHFVKYVKPSQEKKVLLLLDGHSSHKSLDALVYAKENGIIIFCFPPHCTHRVQPLDVSFYSPLVAYYNQELTNWLKNHPGRVITHFQVGTLFNNAYIKSATIQNALKGFSATGIAPFNPDVFPDWMFAAAEVTDIEEAPILMEAENEDQEHVINTNKVEPSPVLAVRTPEILNQNNIEPIASVPGTSGLQKRVSPREGKVNISIEEISSMPETTRTVRRQRKKGSFGNLTTTPEIAKLKEEVAERNEKMLRKSARSVKKRIVIEDEEKDEENQEIFRTADDEEDIPCIYCNELYSWSASRELWFKCTSCKKWAHAACAGLDRKTKIFVCELCH